MVTIEEILQKGAFRVLPNLPMIEFKTDKWKIKIPNFRILNEAAVQVFEQCIIVAATEEGAECATFRIPENYDKEKIDIITDICMAANFEARKRGGDYVGGSILVVEVSRKEDMEGTELLEMHFIPNRAKLIYKFAEEYRNGESTRINLPELVSYIVKNEQETIEEEILASQRK